MNLARPPLFDALDASRRILLVGAGGGYDVFCGLPLYHQLTAQGKTVYLANLSLTYLEALSGPRAAPAVVEIAADSDGPTIYFPEKFLAEWFADRGEAVKIYGIHRTGYRPVRDAYAALCRALEIDTVVLVDGGTDSLMRGDEAGLGTPQEDVVSIASVNSLEGVGKYLVCIGFGVDYFHGVCHAQFLESVAALARAGAYLGAFSLLAGMPEFEFYRSAAAFVHARMPDLPSIVSSSIISAIEGEFGDHHATERTRGSRLWINPLMGLYWAFRLEAVAARCLYLDRLLHTNTWDEVNFAIQQFRANTAPHRPWDDMPV